MTVYCNRCKTHKPEAAFHKNKRRSTGYDGWCKACGNAYKRERYVCLPPGTKSYTSKRADYIREAKNVPCHDCGERYHYCVMDFDHREGEPKLFAVSRGSSSRETLIAEIAKCDVVCANCHRVRTWTRKMRLREKNAIS